MPKWGEVPDGLLTKESDLVEHALDELIEKGVLEKRKSVHGTETWGPKNKLAVHVSTGLPIDFFATRPSFWYNYLVCRTGGTQTNTLIASRARELGLAWHPYDAGFTVDNLQKVLAWWPHQGLTLSSGVLAAQELRTGKMIAVASESDVFRLAGMPFQLPPDRA